MFVKDTVALLDAVTELINIIAPALGVAQVGAEAPLLCKSCPEVPAAVFA